MVTKKRRATTKVAEAAPSYAAARSGKAKTGSLGGAFWEVFQRLPEEDRGAFLSKLLADDHVREDVMDICVVMSRRGEPVDDYGEFEKELRSEGLL